jgi:putative membrane protein
MATTVTSPATRHTGFERSAIVALFAVTVMAAAGYSIYALHPERLAATPIAGVVYGYALRFAPPAHIIVGVLVLAAILTRRVGAAWIPAAVTLYCISLSSELLGTTTGIPFGPYRYTDGLGIKWFAHVPVLIPASWFMMALPSFALATRWISANRALRIVVAAGLLVSWDLALDPAMSRLMPYWVWGNSGAYYGMPLLNLGGWYVTGLALMCALTLLSVDRWLAKVPTMPLAALYAANLMLPVLMAAAAGLRPAALLALTPFALVGGAAAARARGQS